MSVDAVLRTIDSQLTGRRATDQELQELKRRLPPGLIPDWLASALAAFNLVGAFVSLDSEKDESGLGVDMIWLTPQQIISEAEDTEPGVSVTPAGFLPIGACGVGSGDPYFLDLRKNQQDPSIVRVPHAFGGRDPYPLDQIDIVKSSLSSFLSAARL